MKSEIQPVQCAEVQLEPPGFNDTKHERNRNDGQDRWYSFHHATCGICGCGIVLIRAALDGLV